MDWRDGSYGYTASLWATIQNQTNLAKLLLQTGTDMAKLLLQGEADVNKQDTNGATLLHFAAEFISLDVGRFLVGWGANI